MKKYYIHTGTEQQGPFDIEELKSKHITRGTSIWFEGLPEWIPADHVDELKVLIDLSSPPPFNGPIPTPPPRQKTSIPGITTHQQRIKRISNDVLIILIIVLLLIIAGGGFFIANKKSSDIRNDSLTNTGTYQEKVITITEIERSKPRKFLKAEGNYDKNFWGNKLKIHGLIKNIATVTTYKDAIVRVTFYNKTKTVLGKMDNKIGEIFPPQSETKFELKVEKFKDVDSIGWNVIEALPN